MALMNYHYFIHFSLMFAVIGGVITAIATSSIIAWGFHEHKISRAVKFTVPLCVIYLLTVLTLVQIGALMIYSDISGGIS